MGRGVLQNHENKLSRPYAIFMINGTQLKSKNQQSLIFKAANK